MSISKYQIYDGYKWYNLQFDNLDNKFVEITKINNYIYKNSLNIIISPKLYYNIIFINKNKIKLIQTTIINDKSFKIKLNKIYTHDNSHINFTIDNIIKQNDNSFIADIIFNKTLEEKTCYVHILILNNLKYNTYYELTQNVNNNNLYEINITTNNNNNKTFINSFKISKPYEGYIINLSYNNIINKYTCNILKSGNYEFTLLDYNTQKYKLEYTLNNNNNTFKIIDFQLAISNINKTSIGLQNIIYDNINNYYTANIITPLNKTSFYNGIYCISGNKLINNKCYYTIKNKKLINNDLYEAYLEENIYNT